MMRWIVLLWLVLHVCIILVNIWLFTRHVASAMPAATGTADTQVYALMVTGKTDERIRYARCSVEQFRRQTHPSKRLLIINHHPTLRVCPEEYHDTVHEVCIRKEKQITLGHMRNILLEMVPSHAFWTLWDDDDGRSPDYITSLLEHMYTRGTHAVALTRRYEYNKKTDFAWEIRRKSGLPMVLCRSHPRIRYALKDTMEDVHLIEAIRNAWGDIALYDNRPEIYIRLVHDDNTSLYVNADKKNVARKRGDGSANQNYMERALEPWEERYVRAQIHSVHCRMIHL